MPFPSNKLYIYTICLIFLTFFLIHLQKLLFVILMQPSDHFNALDNAELNFLGIMTGPSLQRQPYLLTSP